MRVKILDAISSAQYFRSPQTLQRSLYRFGSEIEAPLPFKTAKTKLGKLQYHNRNKKRGDRRTGEKASNNAKKYYASLARSHKRIADKRQDFLNKTTTGICQKYAHIRIEDLNVSGMVANRKLSSAINDKRVLRVS